MTMSLRLSLCVSCVHHEGATCTAFPNGIPEAIAYGGDHTVPVDGDHGVRYEQLPGDEARKQFELWRDFTP